MTDELKEDLLTGRKKLGIWGCGFIGMSAAMFYAREGVKVVAYDIQPAKIAAMREGVCDVLHLEDWACLRLKDYIDNGTIVPANTLSDMYDPDIVAHFMCGPTEKDGNPYIEHVKSVLEELERIGPRLIIIESTLTPIWVDALGLEKRNVCIAPRRDWFADYSFKMKTMPRIYCGATDELSEMAHAILSIACDKLIKASNLKTAALIKAMENAFVHVSVSMYNQVAMAYPAFNTIEISELVSTHPRTPFKFTPSLKCSGYCIPLSVKYVLESAPSCQKSALSIFKESIDYNERHCLRILDQIPQLRKGRTAILGLTYKGDIIITALSATLQLVPELILACGVRNVAVHDPYFSQHKIISMLGVESFKYPEGLSEFDNIIIATDHKLYYQTPLSALFSNLKPEALILDSHGVWFRYKKELKEHGYDYRRVGAVDWLRPT